MQDRELTLNAQIDSIPKTVTVIKSDTGRRLKVTIADCDMTAVASAKIYAQKPDGTEVYNNCTIQSSKIYAPITSTMISAVGIVKAEIQLTDSDSKVVTTYPFNIVVKDSLISSSAIESSNEYTALQTLISNASSSSSSSSSESDVLYISVTMANQMLTPSKTFEELKAAYDAHKWIILEYGGYRYSCVRCSSNMATFSCNYSDDTGRITARLIYFLDDNSIQYEYCYFDTQS